MNSPYPDSHFNVEYEPDVGDDLAIAFLAYFPVMEGHRVARAEQILDYLLSDDPLRNGSMNREDLYRIVVSPLVGFYEVYEELRLVKVSRMGYFAV